jgi:hypothetical protein
MIKHWKKTHFISKHTYPTHWSKPSFVLKIMAVGDTVLLTQPVRKINDIVGFIYSTIIDQYQSD